MQGCPGLPLLSYHTEVNHIFRCNFANAIQIAVRFLQMSQNSYENRNFDNTCTAENFLVPTFPDYIVCIVIFDNDMYFIWALCNNAIKLFMHHTNLQPELIFSSHPL